MTGLQAAEPVLVLASASSARRRPSMSIALPAQPVIAPSGAAKGATRARCQRWVPSNRRSRNSAS